MNQQLFICWLQGKVTICVSVICCSILQYQQQNIILSMQQGSRLGTQIVTTNFERLTASKNQALRPPNFEVNSPKIKHYSKHIISNHLASKNETDSVIKPQAPVKFNIQGGRKVEINQPRVEAVGNKSKKLSERLVVMQKRESETSHQFALSGRSRPGNQNKKNVFGEGKVHVLPTTTSGTKAKNQSYKYSQNNNPKAKDEVPQYQINLRLTQTKAESFLRDQQNETKQQREARERRVNQFSRKQNLLANLRCSNTYSQESQVFDDNLILGESFTKQESSRQQHKTEKEAVECSKPLMLIKSTSNILSKKKSSTNVQKKMTLKQYLNFNQISNQTKKSSLNHSISQPVNLTLTISNANPSNTTIKSRRRIQASNTEIMETIKNSIHKDVELMRKNLEVIECLFEDSKSLAMSEQPDQAQIIKIYSVSRMIKDRMLAGNDEIVKFLKNSNPKLDLNILGKEQ